MKQSERHGFVSISTIAARRWSGAGEGVNVCPGTPPASSQAVIEASEEFGFGDEKLSR